MKIILISAAFAIFSFSSHASNCVSKTNSYQGTGSTSNAAAGKAQGICQRSAAIVNRDCARSGGFTTGSGCSQQSVNKDSSTNTYLSIYSLDLYCCFN